MSSLPDRWHSAILKNGLDLMRYDAHLRTEILALLKALGRDLVKELAGAGLDTPRSDWQRARLRELLKAATERIGGAYDEVSTAHAEGLAAAAEHSASGLTLALNGAAGAELLSPIKWSAEQLAALVDGTLIEGAPSATWWARQSQGLAEAFADQMRMGMVRGEAVGDLVKRVKALQGIASENAERLVRTSAMAVNNAAHLAVYAANADIIAKLEWTATLDSRTCVRCGAQDGTSWPLGDAHVVPPLHWNCRCVTVPLTKTWEELATRNKGLARKLDDMPPGMRSSMGGPVSAGTTWESWFKGLGAEEQADILGPARMKLWKGGKLTLAEFVDQRGNTLTLEDLRAR